jgi:NTE family protein
MNHPKIGVALSGGGAKGVAHIGALKVLEEAQIPVHALAGTSMGGLVAAIYAAGRSAAEIEQIVRAVRILDIAQRDRTRWGLLGQDKIAQQIREALGGDLTFDQLELPLALLAADLETGEEVVIREGSVVEGVLATTAFPMIFPPVRWQGRLLVDGGVLNPVPSDVVRQMDVDRVIAVHTRHALPDGLDLDSPPLPPRDSGGRGTFRTLLHRSRWTPVLCIGEHSLGIMTQRLAQQRWEDSPPDVLIDVPLKNVGLFELARVSACLKSGEEAARERLPELIKLRDEPLPSRWTKWWHSTVSKLVNRASA